MVAKVKADNFAEGQERLPRKNTKKRTEDSGSFAKGEEKLPRLDAIDREKPGTFADKEKTMGC